MKQEIYPATRLAGELRIPADKSISHRAIMLSSIANGTSYVRHPLLANDVQRTIAAFQKMGIDIVEERTGSLKINGRGIKGLEEPTEEIDVGNSGTTIRLLMGLIAAQPFHTILSGDSSIARRPMARVAEPLRLMGSQIEGRNGGNYAPLAISGKALHGITYKLPIASAQVKSAIIFAGLYAQGMTTIIEPIQTRDHTERMLRSFGVPIEQVGTQITISQQESLVATEIKVPGDFSSAAFFIAAAILVPNSDVVLKRVGLNPTRTGFLNVLQQMGVEVEVLEVEMWGTEEVADLRIKQQALKGTVIEGDMIPRLIDEIPILAVLATQAEGITEIRNAEELRVKESDRIAVMAAELRKMNANIEELPDGLRIVGRTPLHGSTVYSHHDHRVAMSLLIAGLIAKDKTTVEGIEAIAISYPNFMKHVQSLIK